MGEEILPLGVRAPRLVGRALQWLAAVVQADQADDRVTIGDPSLELLVDLKDIGQIEYRLVVHVITALAQRIDCEPAKAFQIAVGGADEDASLGHEGRDLPTRTKSRWPPIVLDTGQSTGRSDQAALMHSNGGASVIETGRWKAGL